MTGLPEPDGPTTGIELEGAAFWPDYEPEHPLRTRSMAAFLEVTGITSLRSDGPPTQQSTAALVLQVSCLPDLHRTRRGADDPDRGPPMLAEVWATSSGLLFLASVPGRWDDPQASSSPEQLEGCTTGAEMLAVDANNTGDDPVPVTIVRVLLEDPARPRRLQVKCRVHGLAWVDSAAVHRQALQMGRRSRSGRSRVVSLTAVRAVE